MGRVQAPLSPHLQIYRPQLTSVLSITHRATGVLLALALLVAPYWLLSIAAGPDAYKSLLAHFQAWYGRLFVFGVLFSTWYHLCNGVRHLGWDLGHGLDLGTTYLTGYAVVFLSVLLTLATCLLVRLA
jgi:succinate dehydrogenase / fumarate reductase cytochrome b subunit